MTSAVRAAADVAALLEPTDPLGVLARQWLDRAAHHQEQSMTVDVLDPGPNGDYPYWPRNPDAGTYMPTGVQINRTKDGETVLIDLTPRHPDGTPIDPDAYLTRSTDD